MSGGPLWYCKRQRAGPLVKECRALRPRLSREDSPWERGEKNKLLRPGRDACIGRSRVDRLEMLLALFGVEGIHYTLTYDDEHLPPDFQAHRAMWRCLLYQLRKWHPAPLDYVYCLEGRHGDHRYHIHLILRESDFPPAVLRHLWTFGADVDSEPLLLSQRDTYRRMAKYLNKEATDGVTIPIGARTWVASQSLRQQLPPVEVWRDESGSIPIPDAVDVSGRHQVENSFGSYYYAWYIEEQPRPWPAPRTRPRDK